MSTYSQRLAAAIEHKGMTQQSLADETGVSQQTINYLLTKGKGSAHTNKFARTLGVRADWLADDDGEMTSTQPADINETSGNYNVSINPDDPELREAFELLQGLKGAEREAMLQMLRTFAGHQKK